MTVVEFKVKLSAEAYGVKEDKEQGSHPLRLVSQNFRWNFIVDCDRQPGCRTVFLNTSNLQIWITNSLERRFTLFPVHRLPLTLALKPA